LKIDNIEIDHVERKGRVGQPNRPIVVTLLRTKDKFTILRAKHPFFKDLAAKKIFINEELTDEESKRDAKLRKKGAELKATTPVLKTAVIRGILQATEDQGKWKLTRYRLVDDQLQELN